MSLKAPIHKNHYTTIKRIEGFISTSSLFKDINLSSKLYKESRAFSSLTHFSIPKIRESGHGDWLDWEWNDIIAQPFLPAQIGQSFGPTWTTHWFKVVIDIGEDWIGKEVHLRWLTGSEGCVYNSEGKVLQGVCPDYREEYIISHSWPGGGQLTFYIEMSCNDMFGASLGIRGPNHSNKIAPTDLNKFYTLTKGEIALFDRQMFNLQTRISLLYEMALELGESQIGYKSLFTANQMINWMRRGNLEEPAKLADAFFSEKSGEKSHTLYAMGHCHIDTAWLWCYDETIRKCARSFSAQLRLMEEYPHFKFVCSSAQQYAWVKEYYPGLFVEIQAAVKAGAFVPVGGTWLEMDGNLPSGESFIRQFLYGQEFFKENFDMKCTEFWLPDTFGYSAQIPQILKHVGISRFLTQKMSWNLVNVFPNHNFIWEGIDGSSVICHFPPGNSYNMSGSISDFLKSQNNSLDKGRCNVGAFIYGNGDGGGGPTRTMIERIKIVNDCDGLPKVEFSDSTTFFQVLEKEKAKFYKWVGELYLELHNGTYTSQARIKWYNRKGEFLLREVELLMCGAYFSNKIEQDQLKEDMIVVDGCWKKLLLNQFHDVLPGTCIEQVTKDAWEIYEGIFITLMALRNTYHKILLGPSGTKRVIFNPLPWEVRTVIFNKPDSSSSSPPPPPEGNVQLVTLSSEEFEDQIEGRYRVPNTFSAALVTLRASGYSEFIAQEPKTQVSYIENSPEVGVATLSNGLIQCQVRMKGPPVENLFMSNGEQIFKDFRGEGVVPGMFYIYQDIPEYWDAWDVMDYQLETRQEPNYSNISEGIKVVSSGPIVGCYKWSATFGNGSTLTRYTILRADSPMLEYYTIIDWKEEHKMLKVEFSVDVIAREATFEIQYGHTKRPTHTNTSWDMAKFEVCGHKWMDISQSGRGLSIITDAKYGWHVRGNVVSLSLLRSPKNPDPNCDIHKHFIYYGVLPHEGSFQEGEVIRRAYQLNFFGANNIPIFASEMEGAELPSNWVTSSSAAVVVEAFKVASFVEKSVVIRLYESFGGSASTMVGVGFSVIKVEICNGLEEVLGEIPSSGNQFFVHFKPFQIQSFLLTF